MRLDRLTLNRARWPTWLRRISIAKDVLGFTILGLIGILVIWGTFR